MQTQAIKRTVKLKRIFDETVFFVREGDNIVDLVIDQRTWNSLGGPISMKLTIEASKEDE